MCFSIESITSAFNGTVHALETQVPVNQSAAVLCAIGAVNWGAVALYNNDLSKDLVHQIARQLYPASPSAQEAVCTAVYSAVGVAGGLMAASVIKQNVAAPQPSNQ